VATTAFGFIHMITDYMIIGRLRGTDTTPSFGYLTVATITISAHPDRDHDPTHATAAHRR
jgi:hypothetical protein